jgi:hypothetical protein
MRHLTPGRANEIPPVSRAHIAPSGAKDDEPGAERENEPIRSLGIAAPATKAAAVTLGGRDDAPINPFPDSR